MTSIRTSGVVGPDGALDLHVPNLPPGERVSITIEVPEASKGAAREATPQDQSQHLTALDLLQLPLEERHRILAQSVAEAAEAFRTDAELMEFSALDAEDWEDTGG
jgi:hypothetical protein